MITTQSTISLTSQVSPQIIQAVQGDTGRSICFKLADFTIPAGASATYYIQKPSGEAIYNSATISGNEITCELTAQSLAELGENQMQVRIIVDEEIVTSFDVILLIRPFHGIDAIESGTEINIFDQAVEKAAEDFQEQAEEIVQQVIEEIPADYTALTEEVDELNERLNHIYSNVTISRGAAGSAGDNYTVSTGDVLRITNTSTGGTIVRLRSDSTSTENLQVINILSNETVYVVAETNAGYLSVYFNASGSLLVETGDFINTKNDVISVDAFVDSMLESIVTQRPNAGARLVEKTVSIGDVFRITNTCDAITQVRLRATSDGENLEVFSVGANSTGFFTAHVNASYMQVYFQSAGTVTIDSGRLVSDEAVANNSLENSKNVLNMLVLEQGGITTGGEYTNVTTRLRTKNTIEGSFLVKVPDGYVVYYAMYFDALGYLNSYTSINKQIANISVPSGYQCKLTFAKADTTSNLTVNDLKDSLILEQFDSRLETLESSPLVKFTYDHELDSDVATIVAEKQYTISEHSMEDIYSYFDDLVDNDYVTKVDLAEEMEIAYPAYASDYKTYMYKLICTNANVNTGATPKKKVIILGGVHGDEQAAPFNLYLLADKLCNDYLTDENVFKLRSAFDFYIVPCVNGYGMNHTWRLNGNGVNINRNFPIEKWSKYGSAGEDNYTGETPGSEFETQLIIALVNDVKPDMFIDHHNFTYNLNTQFYTDVWDKKLLPIIYESLVDISYTFKKGLPEYFGAGFDFVKNNGGSPAIKGDTYGGTSRWAFEQFVPFAGTIEIGDCITYWNGSHAGSRKDYYGTDTFTVAEYSLRNQLLHYCQWVLENA